MSHQHLARAEPAVDLFNPSAETGRALRSAVNASFADSLEYLFEVCRPYIAIPGIEASALISRLRSGSRETPYLYALHFNLIAAIQSNLLDEVEQVINNIVNTEPAIPGVVVASLIPGDLPWDTSAVLDYFAYEEDSLFSYAAPEAKAAAETTDRLRCGLELISEFAPGLAAELEQVVTTVIVAQGVLVAQGKHADADFGSVTALRAFGGILFNVNCRPPDLDLAAALIHEHAHTVLFALSPNEGVVKNPDSERYASPLRQDPRPLEGIFHQTFVLARMIYGMEQIRCSDHASATQKKSTIEFIKNNVPRYFDGLGVVRKHGNLTEEGQFALQTTENFMAGYR